MSDPTDNRTAYGPDQDREPTQTTRSGGQQNAADRNPDDFGPDAEDGPERNPSTGTGYGEVDSPPR
jgi:hypothetical protein